VEIETGDLFWTVLYVTLSKDSLDSFIAIHCEQSMSTSLSPLLRSLVDRGVLVLTITQPRIQGEEIAQKLREELQCVVESAGANRVVIDLQHTRYLSSVAFWPLLSLRRQLLSTGGRLLICGLSGDVEDIFTTTRMISTGGRVEAPFEVATDAAAAVARLLEDARPA
jgi:anti-anti-sigma factor